MLTLKRWARAFWKTPSGALSAAIILVLVVVGIVAPVLWGPEAGKTNMAISGEGPSAAHWFGTDRLGRDILLRTLVATQLSLALAVASAAVASGIGFPAGVLIALLGPRGRSIGARVIDMLLAFPGILVAIFISAIVGVGAQGAVLAIGIAFSPSYARVANSMSSAILGRDYMGSAKVLGIGSGRLMIRYILPNIAETIVITISTAIASSLIAVSSLNFLGLGVQPPQYDWGRMLVEGVNAIYVTPLAALAPTIALAVTGLSVGLLGEAMARVMNPLLWTASDHTEKAARGPATAVPAQAVEASGCADALTTKERPSRPLLHVEALTVTVPTARGEIRPVDGISFDVSAGELVGVVGESGSGKSTTALAIAQLVPFPGHVAARSLELHGQDLLAKPSRDLQRLLGTKLAMVFQDPMSSLNPALRIGTQLTEGAEIHRRLSRTAATKLAVERLKDVHFPNAEFRLKQFPHEFSGGMRQRAMIAMGLMNQPSLIIADEPTSALDVTVQAQILDVLRALNKEFGTAILLISHDIDVISEICTRVLVMYSGRIVEDIHIAKLTNESAHPYTRALMAAVPEIAADRDQPLATIPGRPPDLSVLPPGCAFAPRCPEAAGCCSSAVPALVNFADGHRVACWKAQELLNRLPRSQA